MKEEKETKVQHIDDVDLQDFTELFGENVTIPPQKIRMQLVNNKPAALLPGIDKLSSEPFQALIVLMQGSRFYFSESFGEGGAGKPPACMSTNRIIPTGGTKPISKDCKSCPMSKWGSGDKGTGIACREHTRLVVQVLGLGKTLYYLDAGPGMQRNELNPEKYLPLSYASAHLPSPSLKPSVAYYIAEIKPVTLTSQSGINYAGFKVSLDFKTSIFDEAHFARPEVITHAKSIDISVQENFAAIRATILKSLMEAKNVGTEFLQTSYETLDDEYSMSSEETIDATEYTEGDAF